MMHERKVWKRERIVEKKQEEVKDEIKDGKKSENGDELEDKVAKKNIEERKTRKHFLRRSRREFPR